MIMTPTTGRRMWKGAGALLGVAIMLSCRPPEREVRSLLPDMPVAERTGEPDLIDARAVESGLGEHGLELSEAGDIVLPLRRVSISVDDITGTLTGVALSGVSTSGSYSVPVSLNDAPLGDWVVSGAISSQTMEIPPKALRPGRNTLLLDLAAPRRSILDGRSELRLLKIDFLRRPGTRRSGPGTLAHGGGRIDGFWQTPDTPEIVVCLPPANPGGLVVLSAAGEGKASATLRYTSENGSSERSLEIKPRPGGLDDYRVPLEAGQYGRLSLRVRDGVVFWGRPRITERSQPDRRVTVAPRTFNVMIYVVDALRADALQPYGYARETSPFLQRHASECMVFQDALGSSSWTKPSVASLLTGLTPIDHQTVAHDRILHAKLVTIAERLPDFHRVFITAHHVLAGDSGFTQGFDVVDDTSASGKTSEPVDARLRERLRDAASSKKPLLLYVHTGDTHYPYRPVAPFDRLVQHTGSPLEAADNQASRGFINELKKDGSDLTPRDVAYLRSLYDAEVARADHYFGKAVQELKQRGMFDDTLIIFTADHGEEFRDHGGFLHGHTLYQEVVRLPWIVKPPKGMGSPGAVKARIRQIDMVPTLLELLGRKVPAELQGRSYAALFFGGTYSADTAFAETRLGERIVSATSGPWRLIVRSPGNPARERRELYNLVSDPSEMTSVAAEHPFEVGFLRQELRRWSYESASRRSPDLAGATTVLSEKEIEDLKDLGYLD